jgi:hypothetical protein
VEDLLALAALVAARQTPGECQADSVPYVNGVPSHTPGQGTTAERLCFYK